jgi:pro-kumamolisin-like protein/Big-like domain-containing protein
MKIGQSTSSANGTAHGKRKDTIGAAKRILTAALMGLAATAPGLSQTGAATELPGLVPPAVANGTAVAAGSFSSNQMLRLVFGLRHPHMAEEEQFLEALHTKGSQEYMHFLTADGWNARFSPSQRDEQAVVDWAQAQGLTVTQRFANRLLVDVEAPVSAIEAALAVKINSYAIDGASYYSNDRNPAVPAALGNIVHSVGGLNNIQIMKPGNHGFAEPEFSVYSPGPAYALGESGRHNGDRTKLAGANPGITNGAYDPTDLYSSEAYDVNALYALRHCCNPLGNPNSPPETSIAIVTAGSQSGSDITGFQGAYPYIFVPYQLFTVDGTPPCCDPEGTLDLEWSSAMTPGYFSGLNNFGDPAMIFMYDGANALWSTFTDAYNHALSDGFARVFSTSWGGSEFVSVPQSVMDTDHGIFNSMIGQGWTLVAFAGDTGATADCLHQDGVTYPGSDPDVVSAGGSSLQLSAGPIFDTETAWTGGADGCATNDGGSGGGASAYYAAPSYMALPSGSKRPVPDIALNADWLNHPQNFYFNGSLTPTGGGTGIVASEVAGFFAQANAYVLYVTTPGGCGLFGVQCVTLGNGDWYLYFFGLQPNLAPHYPFYDITSGCNNNDVTEAYHLGFQCAGPGRDQVTGWGSFNFLQLAWAINFDLAGDFGAPAITFSGPALNKWYNTNQTVSWTISDTSGNSKPPTGVAGFSEAWDTQPGGGDPSSEATPGTGNSFYSGPQFPNQTSGCLGLAGTECLGGSGQGSGQGWHTVDVRAWDNTGIPAYDTYGPIGYDTVPPQTTGHATTGIPAQITLTATDASSGVASTVYQLDGGSTTTYGGPFPVSSVGSHTLTFHSTDNAGNVESTETLNFTVGSITTTAVTSSVNPSQFDQGVAFTATVSSAGGTPAGTVTFFNGSTQMGVATLSAGKATLHPVTLQLGSRSIAATYSGSGKFSASSSPVFTQTVNKANTTTTLTSAPNPSAHGSLVAFTATVTGDFGGSPISTVSFMKGTAALGTGALNASTHQATFTTSSLPAGTSPIHAVYGGNVDFNGSTSPVLKQVVR